MKKISLLFTSILAVFALVTAQPALAQSTSDTKDLICQGANAGGNCDGAGAEKEVNQLIETVVGILSWIVGIVSVIMIIIGGLKYITSSGDSGNVTSAKNTILYAIIGLVVVIFAQIIVRFVVNTAA